MYGGLGEFFSISLLYFMNKIIVFKQIYFRHCTHAKFCDEYVWTTIRSIGRWTTINHQLRRFRKYVFIIFILLFVILSLLTLTKLTNKIHQIQIIIQQQREHNRLCNYLLFFWKKIDYILTTKATNFFLIMYTSQIFSTSQQPTISWSTKFCLNHLKFFLNK